MGIRLIVEIDRCAQVSEAEPELVPPYLATTLMK